MKKKFEKQERTDLPPLPVLPQKDFFNKNDANFIHQFLFSYFLFFWKPKIIIMKRRRFELERYLQLLAVHPYISRGKDSKKIAETLLSILPGSLQSHLCCRFSSIAKFRFIINDKKIKR